jgi:protein SCO1
MTQAKIWIKYIVLIGVLFVMPISLVLLFGRGSVGHFYTLPYFDPNPEYAPTYSYTPPVDSLVDHTRFHSLPPFNLQSHKALNFTNDSLKDGLWMVGFFSLNSPYAKKATEQLLWINYQYRDEESVKILCLSLDTNNDTIEATSLYVEQNVKYNSFDDKWYYLSGNQDDIYDLIKEGFLIHDTANIATMCLLDEHGHIRGRYNASFKEDIKRAIEDIALLKKEMDKIKKQ